MSDYASYTIDQLKQIIAEAQAELSRHDSPAWTKVRVAKSHGCYNERRYGKPWIAVVTGWPVGGRPELSFGYYTGRPGEAGDAEIMALPGQLVRWGQKDNRGGNTDNNWGIVREDGSVDDIDNQQARSHWTEIAAKLG